MSTLHVPPTRRTPDAPTEATRHLCAGVYLDEKFRDLVVNAVCTTPYRRVAPSYGFDLVPVMRHAWWATHLAALPRAAVIAVVVLPLLWGQLVAASLVLCGLLLAWMLRHAVRLSAEATRSARQGAPRSGRSAVRRLPLYRTPDRRKAVQALRRLGGKALLVAVVGVLLASGSPEQLLIAVCSGAAVCASALSAGAVRQLRLNAIRSSQRLCPKKLSRREAVVDQQQEHDCVVFPRPDHHREDEDESALFTVFGDESPFVGAGELIHQWNPPMNIQLLRAENDGQALHEREYTTPPFQAHELVDHLRRSVQRLQEDEEDVRLPATVRDRVYVAENDVSVARDILESTQVPPDRMRRIVNGREPGRHHFLEVSVPSAGAELVATVLLQVRLQGRTLGLSFAACALTRTPRRFQQVKEFGQHGKWAVVWAAASGLWDLPQQITSCWKAFLPLFFLLKTLVLGKDLTLRPIRNVHIGTRTSIRAEQAQDWSKAQLDKTDILRQIKSLEERLLAANNEFLRSRGVDTSDFEKRANTIINNSFDFGSNNHISNSAVGNGAQAGNVNVQQGGQTVSTHGGQQ